MDPNDPEKNRAVKTGPVGLQLITAMQQSMKALIDNQFTLIIDELLFDEFSMQGYLNVFSGYKVYFIAVKPPVEVVKQRERDRGDRVIGVGELLYEPTYGNKIYDLVIDSSLSTPHQSAKTIVDFIQKHPHPEVFLQNK